MPMEFELEINQIFIYYVICKCVPSVPPQEPIYPQLQAQNFSLQRINQITNTLNQEPSHHRLVAKNYKWTKKSLAGVLPALVFSRHCFAALVLVPLFRNWPAGNSSIRRCWWVFHFWFLRG